MTSVFKKQQESEKNVKASLYVGNLDPQVSEPLLYELFIQFGPLKSINLPKDRILKTHQGFGFVEFRTAKDAEYTFNVLSGIRLYGKSLNLRKTDNRTNNSSQNNQVGTTNVNKNGPATLSVDVGAKLFIKNLNPLVDEQYLWDTFSKFGDLITPPVLARDSETGASKLYAFLTYGDFAISDEVIEKMDGSILMNSRVSIAYAFKEDAGTSNTGQKRARHGDKVERLLAESLKANRPTGSRKKNGSEVIKRTDLGSKNDNNHRVSKSRGKRNN